MVLIPKRTSSSRSTPRARNRLLRQRSSSGSGRIWERSNASSQTPRATCLSSPSFARAHLRGVGIDYRSYQKTVVFWSEQRGCNVRVDLDLYQRLILKGESEIGYRFGRLLRFEPNNPIRGLPRADHTSISREQKAQAEAWQQKYPRRNGCRRLAALFSQGEIEPNTPFWHAVAVLTHHERYNRGLMASVRDAENSGLTAEEAEEALKEASEVSFSAGLSAAAFVRKLLAYDVMAMRKAKLKRAEASGKASNSKRAARVAAFWSEIEALAPPYPQISEDRLVDQAFENAVAKDLDLWRPGRGQKEAYLSEDIRSVEPYKARYYAHFPKPLKRFGGRHESLEGPDSPVPKAEKLKIIGSLAKKRVAIL